MIMKKIGAVICSAVMAVTLFAGCQNAADRPSTETSQATEAEESKDAQSEEPAEATNESEEVSQETATDPSLKVIQDKGYFIVGLDDSFPPMGYADSNGEIVGFDIDLAKAVAEKLGVDVQFQPVVWDNIVQEVDNRNVDVIWNGCTITDARKEAFHFSTPYMFNKQVVVVLKDSAFQTLDDLAGKSVAIQDGSSANIALDNHPEFKDTLQEVVGFAENARALQDLAANNVDAVIVDSTVYGYYLSLQPDVYRMLDQDLGSEEFGIAFHKDDNAFREAVDAALAECLAEGKTAELANKWLGTDAVLTQSAN